MTRENAYTRRRMLRLTGAAGSIALVAGCGGPEGEDDADVPAEEETGNGQEQEGDIGADDEGDDGEQEEQEEQGNGDDTGAENISGDEADDDADE
ncbi:hypothetical protein [Natronoglomus mannanivorans]|uniref:Uncharacterized protein n=1 Tax=Natronoglomus mannanivorans TaxID=2979990 RepID=A0AAP2YWQ5_9EURY|nr:hypothetical protein [Halobacteria archaeon AArc-xg1-1]